jgi:hypothetical protein
VSFAAIAVAWIRCEPAAGRAVAAAGIVMLAPYATFYNWALLAVAGALLLHANVRPRWLTPAILIGVAAAAAATQNATPFPSQDALAPAATHGLYWPQPAVLLSVAALAIAGRPSEVAAPVRERSRRIAPALRPSLAYAAAGAACAMVAGFYGAAFVSRSGPFEPASYFGRGAAVRALPADFPVPASATLDDAGAGATFPYRVEWKTAGSVSDVAAAMTQRLADGSWKTTGLTEESSGEVAHLRAGRAQLGAEPAVAGDVTISREPDGSTMVRVEFAPLPLTLIPGYDAWLRDQGVIVTNVSPEDYDRIR